MDELDLFEAIGQVDEELLIDKTRRITPLRKMGLIAAVLTLAILTACAAPVVLRTFQAVSGGEVELTKEGGRRLAFLIDNETGERTMVSQSVEPAQYRITLDIAGEGVRPDALEELYAPVWIPEDYVNSYEESETDSHILRYVTDSWAGFPARYVEFRQSLLPEGNPVTFTDSFTGFRGLHVNRMDGEYVVYGEAAVLELREEMDAEEAACFCDSFMQISRYLYWSDGAYLFRLEIPWDMDSRTVEQIITSVQIVKE